MKYLLVTVITCLLASSLLAYSPEPVPICQQPSVHLKSLPISLHEMQTYNMNDFFYGLNLEFNLSESAPDFVRLSQKLRLNKNQSILQTGLKNYHLEHRENSWGNNLITLSEQGQSSKIRWGKLNQMDLNLEDAVTVESDINTHCLDAVWYEPDRVAIVDCVKKMTDNETKQEYLQNVFLYVNTSSHTKMDVERENDMYVDFKIISRRKLMAYEEDGQRYLIRAYFADGVNQEQRENTYLQIMVMTSIYWPTTLKIMDRSFLFQDKLSMTDFKLYLGDMYILDEHSGVTRFDITKAQDILITGRYRTNSGYIRLGVFANNLDNEVILALATSHSIVEVDWSNTIAPKIIAKYSIMDSSIITSLWVNEQYVIVEASANITHEHNGTDEFYNATLVFVRGTRTYMNAHIMLPHRSARTAVDLDFDKSLMMTIDQYGVVIYEIGQPNVIVYPIDPQLMNKEFQFKINALSSNPFSGHSQICSFDMIFTVVDVNSKVLWPTGITIPKTYYANYPGQLAIPLDRYVLGPNVTYWVNQSTKDSAAQQPNWWIQQQNITLIHWNKEFSTGKITFLRQEQYDSLVETDLYIYTQDAFNMTHFVKCRTVPFTADVYCDDDSRVPHINRTIQNLTANRFHYYDGQYMHLAAFVYADAPNEVHIADVEKMRPFLKTPLNLGESYEGRITSIEFLGPFLAIVLRYTKQIVFFDMNQCRDANPSDPQCKQVFRIDSRMMDRLGVRYFAPVYMYVSDFHPFVAFIQCIDRVVIIDFAKNGIVLLDEVMSPASQEVGYDKFRIAITRDHLLLINPPNIIQEHSLKTMRTKKDVPLVRTYPVYNYQIPDKFDVDFSDSGDLIYITAIDKNLPKEANSAVLVYRAGIPAVAAFYDVYHLYGRYDQMLIDATGNFGDYVTVTLGSMLLMFRQYSIPILVFENSYASFQFNITFTNDPQEKRTFLSSSEVKISNHPQKIQIANDLLKNESYLTSQIKYKDQHNQFKFWDHDWFNGSVINYTLVEDGESKCDSCGDKLKVINHLQDRRDLLASMDMEDYVFTMDGGVIQQFQSVIKMRHNGSIDQYATFPAHQEAENCNYITHNFLFDFTVSACNHNGEIYLYVTTMTSAKPFVQGPFYSGATAVANLMTMGQLLVLVDVDQNPWRMSREGGIIIYSINHDPNDPQMFDELQIIDTDDLAAANGWPQGKSVYIGNAHFVWTNVTDYYRLIITELNTGIFVVDFKFNKVRDSISIVSITYINLHDELAQQNLMIPNMAYFEGITVVDEYYSMTFGYWQIDVVITMRNFHMLQFGLHISNNGQVLSNQTKGVYFRYGFYQTNNYIKSFDGYFAVVQKVPILWERSGFSKQVLTIYDTRPRRNHSDQAKNKQLKYPGTDLNMTYMLGGMTFPVGRITFDFNFTFERNESDPFRDLGLLVLHARQAIIREININDQLSIVTQSGIVHDQKAMLRAWNDYSSVDIPVSVLGIGGQGLPGWAIALIVVGSLGIACAGGFFAYRFFMKKRSKDESQIQKSLLEQEADEGVSGSQESSEDQSSDSGQDSQGSEDGVVQETPKREDQKPVTTINATFVEEKQQINRESIEQSGETQQKVQPVEPKEEEPKQ